MFLSPHSAVLCLFFFFFQAEDGIRDLVRSRGLGDVYKRQALPHLLGSLMNLDSYNALRDRCAVIDLKGRGLIPVSYTHLTLPTSDLV